MSICTELTVSIKGSEISFKKKFLIYEPYIFSQTDPVIQRCVNDTMSELQAMDDYSDIDIKIRASTAYFSI